MNINRLEMLSLSLSNFLLIVILTVNLACIGSVSAYVLYRVNDKIRLDLEKLSEVATKTIQLQALRISVGADHQSRFPDLDLLQQIENSQGVCIKFTNANSGIITKNCYEFDFKQNWPRWFEQYYSALFFNISPVTSHINYHNKHFGKLSVTQSKALSLTKAWEQFKNILLLSTALLISISLLLIITMKIALKPIETIKESLRNIAKNQFTQPVSKSHIREWLDISVAIQQMGEKLQQGQIQNQHLAKKLVVLQEQERQSIAQELHDQLAQYLAGLSATHATLIRLSQQHAPGLIEHIQRANQISEVMRQQCRQILTEIKPVDIDNFTLAENLNKLVKLWNEQAMTTEFQLIIDGDLSTIPTEMTIHLYRIIQEGLTNIAKHANAQYAWVVVSLEVGTPQTKLFIKIEDDGDLKNWNIHNHNGFGIQGIQDRVSALNGHCEIKAREPHGLKITVNVPIAESVI